jgi:hypothetical protein
MEDFAGSEPHGDPATLSQVAVVNPFVEFHADNLLERLLGVFMLCGFSLQSLQYWLAVLDIAVT